MKPFGYDLSEHFKDWKNYSLFKKGMIIIFSPIIIPLIETEFFIKIIKSKYFKVS